MNRYFVLSCVLHLTLALTAIWAVGATQKSPQATYTIDFIGSGKVMSMQAANKSAQNGEIKKEAAKPAPEPETKKPAPKAYDSKAEISAKKQTKPKPAPAPQPLEGPSVLDDDPKTPAETDSSGAENSEGEFEGGNIQTDFATFPYPWYITQIRNSLWSEWEKRRPAGNTLTSMISFAIARDGKIKNLKITKSSGDDSFDFSAKSAVINAGPFPPLPMLYEKDELTVTVEFKQEK